MHDLRLGGHHFWRRFPFGISDNRKANTAMTKVSEVDYDALFHGLRVEGIRQMAGLRALNCVDPLRRLQVSSAVLPGLSQAVGGFAARAPDVTVIDVVIVRHGDR